MVGVPVLCQCRGFLCLCEWRGVGGLCLSVGRSGSVSLSVGGEGGLSRVSMIGGVSLWVEWGLCLCG